MTNEVTLDVFSKNEDTTESPAFPKAETGPELPEGWRWVKLGKVAKTTSGGTPLRSVKRFFGGDVPWVKSGELEDGYILKTEEEITEEGLKNSSAKLFPKGTLLVAMYGATVGKTGILGIAAATNQAVCAIFPNENVADKLWIRYFIMYKRPELLKNSFGGAQPNISQRVIRNLHIPLPSLEEQKRIVARIEETTSRIEQAKKLREEALKDTEAIMQSALHQIFSKAEENGWQQVKLKDVCTKIVGGGTPRRNNSRYFNGNIVWLTPTDLSSNGPITDVCDSKTKITEEGLKNSSAQLLPAGTVVYSSRATIGKIAIAGVPLATNQGFANFVYRQDVVLNRFLAYVLKWLTPELQRMGKMTTFPEVKKSTLKLFKILIPFKDGKPDLEEQNRIVAYLDNLQEKVEALRKYQEKTKNEIEAITQTLLRKAFRGNL